MTFIDKLIVLYYVFMRTDYVQCRSVKRLGCGHLLSTTPQNLHRIRVYAFNALFNIKPVSIRLDNYLIEPLFSQMPIFVMR